MSFIVEEYLEELSTGDSLLQEIDLKSLISKIGISKFKNIKKELISSVKKKDATKVLALAKKFPEQPLSRLEGISRKISPNFDKFYRKAQVDVPKNMGVSSKHSQGLACLIAGVASMQKDQAGSLNVMLSMTKNSGKIPLYRHGGSRMEGHGVLIVSLVLTIAAKFLLFQTALVLPLVFLFIGLYIILSYLHTLYYWD